MVFRMSTVSATTDVLGYPLVIRDSAEGPDESARAAGRRPLVVRLFPAFICVQALLIAALLLLNFLDSIG